MHGQAPQNTDIIDSALAFNSYSSELESRCLSKMRSCAQNSTHHTPEMVHLFTLMHEPAFMGEEEIFLHKVRPPAEPTKPDRGPLAAPSHRTAEARIKALLAISAQLRTVKQTGDPLLPSTLLRLIHDQLFAQSQTVGPRSRPLPLAEGAFFADPAMIPTALARIDQQIGPLQAGQQGLGDIIRLYGLLTWVHPFTDGNGRSARMMLDLLLWHLGMLPAPILSLERVLGGRYRYLQSFLFTRAILHGEWDRLATLIHYAICIVCDQVSLELAEWCPPARTN